MAAIQKQNEQAYKSHDPDDLIIRDRLALDRTILANERTILGYMRTSLVLVGGGATLIKLFAEDPIVLVMGWLFIPIGLICACFGMYRFVSVRKSLRNLHQK